MADAARILSGRIQGVPVTSLMSLYYTSPVLVISLKDQNITRLDQLAGKKLGGVVDGASILVWRVAMGRAGLDPDKVQFVGLDSSAQIPALISRQVDVITGQTQPADLEAEGVPVNTIPMGLDLVADSIFANDTFLKSEPETARGFLRATVKGVNYVKDNQPETVAVMSKRFPTFDTKKLDLRQKLEATWVWTKNTPPEKFGLQLVPSWQNLQDVMLESKQIDKKIDIESFVTNDFLPYK
jgi:NitT/TauT family transport system substrate-binding protein